MCPFRFVICYRVCQVHRFVDIVYKQINVYCRQCQHNPIENIMTKNNKLRDKLISIATQLVDKSGLVEFSWRSVAKEAGVSHGAPARHFADKTDLLESVAACGYNELADIFKQAREQSADDALVQLRTACHGYLDYALRHPGVIHLLAGGVLPWPAVGDNMRTAGQSAFISFMEIIEEGQARGIFRIDKTVQTQDSEAAINMSYAAWCTIHGLALFTSSGPLRSLQDYPEKLEEMVSSVLDTLLQGVLRPPL